MIFFRDNGHTFGEGHRRRAQRGGDRGEGYRSDDGAGENRHGGGHRSSDRGSDSKGDNRGGLGGDRVEETPVNRGESIGTTPSKAASPQKAMKNSAARKPARPKSSSWLSSAASASTDLDGGGW